MTIDTKKHGNLTQVTTGKNVNLETVKNRVIKRSTPLKTANAPFVAIKHNHSKNINK